MKSLKESLINKDLISRYLSSKKELNNIKSTKDLNIYHCYSMKYDAKIKQLIKPMIWINSYEIYSDMDFSKYSFIDKNFNNKSYRDQLVYDAINKDGGVLISLESGFSNKKWYYIINIEDSINNIDIPIMDVKILNSVYNLQKAIYNI